MLIFEVGYDSDTISGLDWAAELIAAWVAEAGLV